MERQGTHRLRPVPPSIPLPAGRRGVPPLISSEQYDPPTPPTHLNPDTAAARRVCGRPGGLEPAAERPAVEPVGAAGLGAAGQVSQDLGSSLFLVLPVCGGVQERREEPQGAAGLRPAWTSERARACPCLPLGVGLCVELSSLFFPCRPVLLASTPLSFFPPHPSCQERRRLHLPGRAHGPAPRGRRLLRCRCVCVGGRCASPGQR